MVALMPGQSPPDVKIPILMAYTTNVYFKSKDNKNRRKVSKYEKK